MRRNAKPDFATGAWLCEPNAQPQVAFGDWQPLKRSRRYFWLCSSNHISDAFKVVAAIPVE